MRGVTVRQQVYSSEVAQESKSAPGIVEVTVDGTCVNTMAGRKDIRTRYCMERARSRMNGGERQRGGSRFDCCVVILVVILVGWIIGSDCWRVG
jgi:hypothetical protein